MGRFKCDNCGTYVMTIYKGGLCEGCYDKAKEEIKMKNIEVGNLVRFQYSMGSSALGIVTWEKGNEFKAIWSDGNPYREMHTPLRKNNSITGVWEVIDHTKEETKMRNTQTITIDVELTVNGEPLKDVLEMVKDGLEVMATPKEDKLTVAQEASNNTFMAVQGIVQAHAEKNNEEKPEKLPLEDYYRGFDDGVEHAKNDGIVFNFKDFDLSVSRTWKKQNFKDAVSNAALGLTGEAGEVADLIKKAIYHGRGFDNFGDEKTIQSVDVKDELSDVLFYVSAMAQEFGFTLEDIARHNKAKLEKRYSEGFTTKESAEKRDKYGN